MTMDDLRELVGKECLRLAKLGTPEAIAAELASRGIQGTHEGDCCPLACALADTLMMGNGRLWVQSFQISSTHGIGPRQPRSEGPWLVYLREGLIVLSDFVKAFDDGQFPFLESPQQEREVANE